MPSDEEVEQAVRALNPQSAPGSDGFTGYFYSHCWLIIQHDVVAAVKDFFLGTKIPTFSNFAHKILSKILSDRLATVLPLIISREQTGFVKGRSIHENISLAHEIISNIDKKITGGNIAIKLDMSKAYDRVSWRFLIKVLHKLEFNWTWINLIYRAISNCWYSVTVNRCRGGFFRSGRGLRQGDPISPALFIIAHDALGGHISNLSLGRHIKNFAGRIDELNISHLFYADDSLIFMNGDINCVEALMRTLQKYTDISGQVINYSKSSLITSQKLHMSVQADIIATATGFTKAALPILYLGVPLFHGRAKFHYFQELINKFEKKLSGWKSRLLSFGGEIMLLKSVLTSLPIHSFSKLESIMANFLWNAKGNHRRHWIAWDKVCRTLDEGGLGVRSLLHIMNALHAKRCWDFIKGESLWAQYMYWKYGDPRDAHYSTPTFFSPLWRNMMKVLPKVMPYLQWIIARGHIPIWGTNWCGIEIDNPPRFRYNPNISQTMQSHRVRTRSGRYVDIRQYLSPAATALLATLVFTDEPDQVYWTLEHHGEFTTKSYWEYNRHHFRTVAWRNNFWNKYVPPCIGAFLWRLSHNAISVDERLTGIGFKLASKCVCCAMPSRETLDHLFVNSETMKPIWSHFA
ncbi:uncharacterized protein M6B38_143775 [Iris pallida]|uniref:Reverse transcriptase domain-containing protein n=1 Tax=Iris pallida TaxID=29817 RepID=A0AAX6FAM7_IRIPA|nr:uncharacterized protein M6B38_143775 [Iris pallida]